MTLAEYYNLPAGTNATIRYSSFYDTVDSDFPCQTSMTYLFAYQKRRVLKPINVNNPSSLDSVFYQCASLTKIYGLENWNISNNLSNMDYLFYYCYNLTSLDLSKWNTSNVTRMNDTFSNCSNLKSLSSLRADNLSISSYQSPFGYSDNTALVDFGGFINLKSNWNGSYCVDKLKALSHQSLVNILNGLYDFVGNGVTPTSSQGKIKFGSTHLATLTEEEKAIATNKGWTLS